MDDSFQLSFTHVRAPPRGRGHKRKLKPGHSHPATYKRMKHSVVTIKNKDDLCCARAIVTSKAKVDNHSHWQSFQKGAKIQYEQALLLHDEVSVPHGPCGYEELNKFSQAPSLFDYQLLLVNETRGFRVLSFGLAQDKLVTIFTSSLVCQGTLRSVMSVGNVLKNDEGRHACTSNPDHFPACLQNQCSDYMEAKCRRQRASLLCGSCKRFLHGDICLQQHLKRSYHGKTVDSQNVSVCTHRRKWLGCMQLLIGFKEQKEHRCGYVECRSCHEYVK